MSLALFVSASIAIPIECLIHVSTGAIQCRQLQLLAWLHCSGCSSADSLKSVVVCLQKVATASCLNCCPLGYENSCPWLWFRYLKGRDINIRCCWEKILPCLFKIYSPKFQVGASCLNILSQLLPWTVECKSKGKNQMINLQLLNTTRSRLMISLEVC